MASRGRSSLRERADAARAKRCTTLLAVLERPQNVVNIATVIRNVDSLGISKLYIVGSEPTKKKERESLRCCSVGTSKWVYVRYFDTTEDCLAHLEKTNFTSVATSPHVKGRTNVMLGKADFTAYKKLAVWFGSESRGISDEAVAAADICVQIDMAGIGESLNLAVSTGIVLHTIAEQRREWSGRR